MEPEFEKVYIISELYGDGTMRVVSRNEGFAFSSSFVVALEWCQRQEFPNSYMILAVWILKPRKP